MSIVSDDLDAELMAITELPEAVRRLQQLKADKADIESEILFVENWIDNFVRESEIVQVGDKQYKTTPVRSSTVTVNTKRMARLLPEVAARVIKTETVEHLDSEALAKEIELGNVPVSLMAQFITKKPKKTSIRITEYTPRDEQEESDDDQE